jgi:cardiolipin synthase
MLQAIDEAKESVSLATYIFDYDKVGHQFVDALSRAVGRGLEVRVLVDDIGARYHRPAVSKPLKKAGVPVARFLPTLVPVYFPYSNLRIHRKILVADGRIGFTGGMNIRGLAIRDLQFRITGPAVAHLQDVFAEDWEFTTNEVLQGERWFPPLPPEGEVLARGIPDGPDEDFEKLRISLLAALACAEQSVTIVTPYFLPDSALVMALGVAALRGVEVNIILPQQNNLWLVQWASTAGLWEILERGCHVWLSPPPFDHTKLMIVDRTWVLLGSGNWDPRSLRLNFEFNVECYDAALAERLHEQTGATVRASKPVTLADVENRPLPLKLRDGVARLFSPYL